MWADGRSYTGGWQNGKQHGQGVYRQVDGRERVGFWQDGKRVSWKDELQKQATILGKTTANGL